MTGRLSLPHPDDKTEEVIAVFLEMDVVLYGTRH